MYQEIYNFISNSLIGSKGANELLLSEILSHITIILIYIVLVKLLIGCFKVVGGIIRWWKV